MPATPHAERHFTASAAVRDIVIGMADGLTVPFALAAGLSGAMTDSTIVVIAGLAEIAAGAIAMGLGGYLAARTDQEHYRSEYAREIAETKSIPEEERREVAAIFREYGLAGGELEAVVKAISREPKRWVDFMMRFELGLERPDPRRAPVSALTIGASYVVGGIIPLLPYMVVARIGAAFVVSVIVTLLALLIFGGIKSKLTGAPWLRGGVQTMTIGAAAAAAAYVIARAIV
ncbi:MAG TPA: VIT1/CCC1 transporter family protein [Alphaproteobacteria bacterium]|nr:VIT1/CCC1 transporter family protein [Alphaproteobacteria bacterium]